MSSSLHQFPRLWSIVAVAAFGLAGCSSSPRNTAEQASSAPTSPVAFSVDAPLKGFDQDLQSAQSSMRLKPGERTAIPVKVRNPGSETWASTGKFPVMLSYRWMRGQEVLPFEGDRTAFAGALRPSESTSLHLSVLAPSQTGNLTLRISLVQEGVAWFFGAGGKALDIPVQIQ